jgi:hypothetical protein
MQRIAAFASLAIVLAVLSFAGEKYTRGVGVYPGDPDEDFAPILVPAATDYRNLALFRPAYHSSSYDYNLTAQLITDGIKETDLPRRLVTSLSTDGVTNKIERELLVDHNTFSNVNLKGPEGWVQFELAGGNAPLQVDQIAVQGRIRSASAPEMYFPPNQEQRPPQSGQGDWTCMVLGSGENRRSDPAGAFQR